MALKINTNIENDVNEYLLDARSVKGGYVVVSGVDNDTKENLPAATTVEGTLVYDATAKKSYRYINLAWVEEAGSDCKYTDEEKTYVNALKNNSIFVDKYNDKTVVSNITAGEWSIDSDGWLQNKVGTEIVVGTSSNEAHTHSNITLSDSDGFCFDVLREAKQFVIRTQPDAVQSADDILYEFKTDGLYLNNTKIGSGTDVEVNPEQIATATVNKLKVGDTTYDILPQAYKDYLDEVTFKKPEISTFSILDIDGAPAAGTYELGITITVAGVKHKETNTANISGKLSIGTQKLDPSATDVVVDLTAPEDVSATKTYTLTGTDTRGNSMSKSATLTFNRYAYSKLTTDATAPATTLNKEAEQSSFKSNGKEFSYTIGQYLYMYLTETGKQVQTNVLGQWTDADFEESGPIKITQANGATYNYYAYKVGPFVANGSAKYRVK